MADTDQQKLDYRQKLERHITGIPEEGKQIISGNAHKPPYDEKFAARLRSPDAALKSEYATDPVFLKYTQRTQISLMQNWLDGIMTTSCNDFVCHCGYAMGADINLGQFELKNLLQKRGKSRAWVPADGGKKPGYGDVFKATGQHMGISLGFDGDSWLTVEAGQGGPNSTGDDRIKRKRQEFNPGGLEGWCDMRIYLDPRPALPDWMLGMWTIFCGSQTFIYRFNEYYEAFFYPWKPNGDSQHAVPTDTGTVALQSPDAFTVTWSKEGGTEKFKYDRFESFPKVLEKMNGSSSRNELLRGVRL